METNVRELKNLNSEEGQSTIEFLMSFVFVLGFVFVFVRMSIVYTNGYMVHYATFMASRAYLVHDSNDKGQHGSNDNRAGRAANTVLAEYKLDLFVPGITSSLQVHNPDSGGSGFDKNLYVGVWLDFEQEITTPGSIGGRKQLQFRSESFLGREPTRFECVERICAAVQLLGNSDCTSHMVVSDNGC